MIVKKALLFLLFLTAKLAVMADVSLPRIFGDNMVLQRDKPISIWGWAAKGEKLTIQFHQQTKKTKADKSGKWQVYLEPEMAGGPYQLSIKGKNLVTIKNILVGEVWICSGQSNMEMPIAGWGKIDNYEVEIGNASYPQIRQFKVPNTVSTSLQDNVTGGQWDTCSPATAGNFSATAYFFAREIYQRLKIPIGLINTSWGGTQSEAWTSKKAFEESEYFKPVATAMNQGNVDSILQERKARVLKNIQRAQDGKYSGPANTTNWNKTTFDDSKWPEMKLPGVWENQGLDGFDGEIWFRKTITINKQDAGKPAVLELAKIDDIDETYINGVKVGSISTWDELRKYNVAAGILSEGQNVISVKVTDNGGGGGIYGEAADMKLTIGDHQQPLNGNWKFQVAAISNSTYQGLGPNDYPSLLFNAMINPLLPYTIQGAIWYQGEANAGRAYEYRKEFPLMIEDWRKRWNKGNFPFFFVQLSTFGKADANSNTGSNWAELREAQAMTLSLPHTGMAVTTDIGNPIDIHPKNKQDVGKRLAFIALHDVYQQQGEYIGPVFTSNKIEGSRVVLTFTHTGSGLVAKDKYGYIKGFEIAGADKKFYPASGIINGNTITVESNQVKNPVAVRYNWVDDASEGNVFNKEWLPMAPFRTDNWDGITVKNKYRIDW